MVTVLRTETGNQYVSANLQKTIQSLKELTGSTTGNHSDTEVYAALKECNMDANEAAQKLLNQGPFHEVRRKRDKKKENAGLNDFSDTTTTTNNNIPNLPLRAGSGGPRKQNEPANPSAKLYPAVRSFNNFRRGGFFRNNLHETVHPVTRSQEFRVVRDNRATHNVDKETKTAVDAGQSSNNHSLVAHVFDKSSMGSSCTHTHSVQECTPQSNNHMTSSQPKVAQEVKLNGHRNEQAVEKKFAVPSSVSQPQTPKQGKAQSTRLQSTTFAEGVYASASDPVHVPSPNSKSPAIKREVGVVGGHRQSVERLSKQLSQQRTFSSNSAQSSASTTSGSFRPINNAAKKDQVNTSTGSQSAQGSASTTSGSFCPINNAAKKDQTDTSTSSQSAQGSASTTSGSFRPINNAAKKDQTSTSTGSQSAQGSTSTTSGSFRSINNAAKKDQSSTSTGSQFAQGSASTTSGSFRLNNNAAKKDQANTFTGSQSAQMSTNRTFLTQHHAGRQYQPPVGYQKGAMSSKEWRPKSSQMVKASNHGVIGTPLKSAPFDNSKNQEIDSDKLNAKPSEVSIQQVQNVVIAQHIRVHENDRCRLTFGSFGVDTASSPELQETGVLELAGTSRSDEISRKQLNSSDGVRNSGSISPIDVATEQQLLVVEETISSHHVERLDTRFGRESSPHFSASESQQHQDTSEIPNFAAYDPQNGHGYPYFRHMDDTAREQTIPSPQEVLASHSPNSISASSMAMLQQQQPLAQIYPQVHVSHFANVMPYRQFISPVYVPPMGLPGYSSNPTYAHPSNGSSYVLMPGGSSHLAPGNMKFGVHQFKPVPTVSASGFGNFSNPTGYAPGMVGSVSGLEDSSRLKYKDNNLYLPNPQAETSDVWIQNPREHPGMQSTPYYNMQGQAGHPAYMQSHAGHASFNPAAVAQSSHMQFPGVYHPQQPSGAIPNVHHMTPPMGGSLGPAAPSQVGAYQQPQLGHLNWNF